MDVLDEQWEAGEDADKDIGGLSNAFCTLSFIVMFDAVENDWIEVKRGRRPGRIRHVEIRADRVESPTDLTRC